MTYLKIDHENDEVEKLKTLIKYKKKFITKKVKFFVCNDSDSNLPKDQSQLLNQPQFFVQDLQRVILYSTIGSQYSFFPRQAE